MTDRNANRSGYKRTPVGWIPEEWECRRVDEVCTLVAGGTPDTKVREYWDGPIPWVTTSEIDYAPIKKTNYTITEHGLAKSAAKVLPAGTLVMAMYGQGATRGRVATLACAAATNQACVAIIPAKDCMHTFLYQRFCHDYVRLRGLSQGGGQPNLSTGLIGWMPVPLPPLAEQKKIADILSTWDEAIEQTRAMLDATKRRKKALMQQLLTGKKRLAGFVSRAGNRGRRTHRFFSTPLDWDFPKLAEVAVESPLRNSVRQPLTVLSCSKHRGFVESAEYFGKQIHSEDTSNYKVIRRGWFGFPANHVEEGSIGLLLTHDAGLLSPIYVVFKTDERVLPEYLFAVFKTETYRHIFQISTSASVDRRGSLRWDEFALIRVPLPPLLEQRAIAAVLTAADEEIKSLAAKATALERQKKGLMQKLLTGEVRVKT